MEMTFKQYIDNPMGKRNAVFSQRDLFKSLYTEKFDKIFLREAGKINYTLYHDKNSDRYIIHLKIPSETVREFYYDAVIMFYTDSAEKRSSTSLQDYFVKFFSNDPAFVFTYLRVFLKNDLFFEDLKPKSSKLALKEDPKIKNPYEIPGYSKILYFAYIFMTMKNLFNKNMFISYGEQYSKNKLLNNVMHTDDKISLRQELGEKQRKQNAVKERQKENRARDIGAVSDLVKFSPDVKKVKNTKTTGLVKTTNITKRTKTIKKK